MNIPKPESSSDSLPFLKVTSLSKKGESTVEILGSPRLSNGQFGEQILLDCKVGKKEYTWAIKVNSGNHSRLYKMFGAKEAKWKGTVKVKIAEYMGNDYIQIV